MATLNRVPWLIAFAITTLMLASTHGEEQPGSDCYCLSEKLSSLRNVVHLEPVVLNGQSVYLIAEQYGVVHVYDPKKSGSHVTPYFDLSDRIVLEDTAFEVRGLLSIASHPKFEHSKKLFLYSTRRFNNKDYIVVSEITDADAKNENILLWVEQPGNRRNGGQVVFGIDDYLYIFIGDGGPADDQSNDAQNVNSLLGKILRIDVDKSIIKDNRMQYYVIPDDNPRGPGWKEEIYAVGIRNTWRCDKDNGDADGNGRGRIFCGDLGSSLADEINMIQRGANYGWNYKEGLHCFNETLCSSMVNETLPIQVFNRTSSPIKAVIGGPLYRGTAFQKRYGQLIYGDFVTGSVFSLKEPASGNGSTQWMSTNFTVCDESICGCNERARPPIHLLSFGETHSDEVYMLMTSDTSPTTKKCALFLMSPPSSSPVTCGASLSTTAAPFIILLSFLCIASIWV